MEGSPLAAEGRALLPAKISANVAFVKQLPEYHLAN